MNTTYTPRADTLPAQVCAFFMRNPDETLDVEAIADKFDTDRKNIHTQMSRCLDAGLMVREKDDELGYVYKRGPKLKADSTAAATPAPAQAAAPARTPRSNGVKPLFTPPDLDAIQIDTDPALLTIQGKRPIVDWLPLLRRLAVGHSFVQPMAARYTVATAITAAHKEGKARYVTRKIDADSFRCGRVE